MPEQASRWFNSLTDSLDILSLSCFVDQGSNPTKHKLLTPAPPPEKVVPKYGGIEGSNPKIRWVSFCLAK